MQLEEHVCNVIANQILNLFLAGADDNASGVSTILETLRVIAQSNYVFDRSIEFMFYAAGIFFLFCNLYHF